MAGLSEHLAKVLMPARERRSKGEPAPYRIWMRALTRLGTWRAVAAAFGVSESTLRRWRRHQARPSPDKVTAMRRWDRASRMRARLPAEKDLTLSWEFDGRHRLTPGGNLRLRPGTLAAARDAWIQQGPTGGVAAFLAGVGDYWYRQHLAAWDASERALEAADEAADELDLLDEEDQEDQEDVGELWVTRAELEAEAGGYDIDPADYGLDPDDVYGDEIQAEVADYEMGVNGF